MSTKLNQVYRLLAVLLIMSLLLVPTSSISAATQNTKHESAVDLGSSLVYALGVPPPLGPPSPKDPIASLSADSFKGLTKINLDKTVAEANANNDATVGWSFDYVSRPYMFQTEYANRPNERYATISYRIDFLVDGIGPFTRHVMQNIELRVFCDQWHTGQGKLILVTQADRAYLEDPGLAEQIVNVFSLNRLTRYIDSQLRNSFDSAGQSVSELDIECDALGVYRDPEYEEWDSITWSKHPPGFEPPVREFQDQIAVTLTNVKRLKTFTTLGGALYDVVEAPIVEVYANHKSISVKLPNLLEEQQTTVNVPTMFVDRPATNEPLVIIGNLIYPLNIKTNMDSSFVVFNSGTAFGSGTQRLVVPKSYWEPADPVLGTKPLQVFTGGYELTFRVSTLGGIGQ